MIKIGIRLAVAILFITPLIAKAYTFRFLGQKDPIHTDMSIKAWQCVLEHPGENEFDCDNYQPSQNLPKSLNANVNLLALDEKDIYYASIWADDPVRELQIKKLHKVALWTFRLVDDKYADLKDGLPDGMRCTAHFGDMQFMHSMEGSPNLSAKETQQAILDWLTFAYDVAVNKKDSDGRHFTEQEHCTYFDVENPSKFQKSMIPAGADRFPCGEERAKNPWTLGTIFSFNCWIRSETCWEYSGVNDPRTRKAALGAIFHAIQDSYAKGHTSRGNDTVDSINEIECSPIEQFQNYSIKDHDKHGNGDMPAPTLAASCSTPDNPIHGPVTATAEVLRLFTQNASSDTVRNYLKSHVFLLAEESKLKNSGTTELMKAN